VESVDSWSRSVKGERRTQDKKITGTNLIVETTRSFQVVNISGVRWGAPEVHIGCSNLDRRLLTSRTCFGLFWNAGRGGRLINGCCRFFLNRRGNDRGLWFFLLSLDRIDGHRTRAGGGYMGSLWGELFIITQNGRGDRNRGGSWRVSISLGQNGGDSTRFLLERGVGDGNGFWGDSGLARGERNLVAAQLLDFGPHLSDVRINELSAINCEVREDAENGILGSFPGRSSLVYL